MKCNLNIEFLLKYYIPVPTIQYYWRFGEPKLGTACANQKKHTPIPSVRGFCF